MNDNKVIEQQIAQLKKSLEIGGLSPEQEKLIKAGIGKLESKISDSSPKKAVEKVKVVASKKSDKPKSKPTEAKESKYQEGAIFYNKDFKEVSIKEVKNRSGKYFYQLSNRKGEIEETALTKMIGETLLEKADVLKEISWKKKAPETMMKEGETVKLDTTFTAIKVKDKIDLDLKVTANKGDTILVNDEGFPHTVLTPSKAEKFLEVLDNVSDDDTMPCAADFEDMAVIIENITRLLEENAMQWYEIYDKKAFKKHTKEIRGIYKTKGKKYPPMVILNIWTYSPWSLFVKDEWFSLCLDKWKLTKLEGKEIPNGYNRTKIVSATDLKAIYNTEGKEKYQNCLQLNLELRKCRLDGCSEEKKKEIKEDLKKCGNLAKKFEVNPTRKTLLYDEAKKMKLEDKGLKYWEAVRKASAKLKGEWK